MYMKEDCKCAIMGDGNQLYLTTGIIMMQKWLANSSICFIWPTLVRYKFIIGTICFSFLKFFLFRDHMEVCVTYRTTESWPQLHWKRTKTARL